MRDRLIRSVSLCLALLLLLGLAPRSVQRVSTASAPAYTLTDLGPGGAVAINATGQVVGTGADGHAFLYSGGVLTDLGTLPGGTFSNASDINDTGDIVGSSDTTLPGQYGSKEAFLDRAGVLTLLPVSNYGSVALAINNAEQIVGTYQSSQENPYPFEYSNGSLVPVLVGGSGYSAATDINTGGQLVGIAPWITAQGPIGPRAFLDSQGSVTNLGTLPGGTMSGAYGINNLGQVVGMSDMAGGKTHAFLDSGGVMTDLGTLTGGSTSSAAAINNAGQVVGTANTAGGKTHAFLDSGGVMTDLNMQLPAGSSWVLTSATDINDAGQIVGAGTVNGVQHAYLLTPTPILVMDSFNRTIAAGWGTAATGGPYTLYTGNGSVANFAVTSGAGTMLLTTHGANRAAFLLGGSARDVDERVRVSFDKPATGSGEYAYLLARRFSDGSEYRGKLRILPTGAVTVQATRVLTNVEDNLGRPVAVPGLTMTPGQFVWVRLEVTGGSPTTLRMMTWAAGQPEPTSWQYSTRITEPRLSGPGAVGLRAYLAGAATNAPVTTTFGNFQATALGS